MKILHKGSREKYVPGVTDITCKTAASKQRSLRVCQTVMGYIIYKSGPTFHMFAFVVWTINFQVHCSDHILPVSPQRQQH